MPQTYLESAMGAFKAYMRNADSAEDNGSASGESQDTRLSRFTSTKDVAKNKILLNTLANRKDTYGGRQLQISSVKTQDYDETFDKDMFIGSRVAYSPPDYTQNRGRIDRLPIAETDLPTCGDTAYMRYLR